MTAMAMITEQQIFNALDAGYRHRAGIKMHSPGDLSDIADKLEELEDDEKLRTENFNGIDFYFRPNENPKRVVLIGEGKCRVEWVSEPTTAAPATEKVMSTNGNGNHGGTKPSIEITPEKLEHLALVASSDIAIARELGFSTNASNLMKRIRKSPELQAAYDRGLAGNDRRTAGKRGPYKKADKPAAAPRQSREVKPKPVPVSSPIGHSTAELPTLELENVDVRESKPKPVSYRYVNFAKGGQLCIAYEGNLFDLTASDWQLIEKITAQLDHFEAAKPRVGR